MIKRFIKLYTPFICAVIAIIYGVFYLTGYKGLFNVVACEFTGHSILLLYYVYIHSKRMCKWYKLSIIFLALIHVSNLMYRFGILEKGSILYIGIICNIIALMCWLIFMVTRRITNTIHSACKHSEK